ncbi:MAG: hypothetical protein ACFHWX_07695 [Bacteroidota bacterium]
MKDFISFDRAINWTRALFSLLVVFHLTIIIGILMFDYAPVEFLWGGRLKTAEELLQFEFVSLFIMLVCLITVLIRSQQVKLSRLTGLSRIILWILTVLFFLNTIGNILAISTFEKFFAIATLLMSVLCFRLAIEPVKK